MTTFLNITHHRIIQRYYSWLRFTDVVDQLLLEAIRAHGSYNQSNLKFTLVKLALVKFYNLNIHKEKRLPTMEYP